MNRIKNLIFLGYFILTLLLVSVSTLMDGKRFLDTNRSTDSDSLSVIDGTLTANLEQRFDQVLGIHELSVSVMAAFYYFVFSEGKNGVLIGEEDWLFSVEEFEIPKNYSINLDENLDTVTAISRYFQAQGITLVVAPVPAKARLLQGKLRQQWSPKREAVYQYMFENLGESGVHIVDTYAAMIAESSREALFFRSDTHWTPEGAAIVARSTAEYLYRHLEIPPEKKTYATELFNRGKLDGDLTRFIPLASWFSEWGPSPEYFDHSKTYAQSNDLFGSEKVSTALVGTSYSADDRWNFSGFLMQESGRDLANYAKKGAGPFSPMLKLVESRSALTDIDLIVWEIPERFLMYSYSELQFGQILHQNGGENVAAVDFQ